MMKIRKHDISDLFPQEINKSKGINKNQPILRTWFAGQLLPTVKRVWPLAQVFLLQSFVLSSN